jgi:hypothetical protein
VNDPENKKEMNCHTKMGKEHEKLPAGCFVVDTARLTLSPDDPFSLLPQPATFFPVDLASQPHPRNSPGHPSLPPSFRSMSLADAAIRALPAGVDDVPDRPRGFSWSSPTSYVAGCPRFSSVKRDWFLQMCRRRDGETDLLLHDDERLLLTEPPPPRHTGEQMAHPPLTGSRGGVGRQQVSWRRKKQAAGERAGCRG